MANKIDRAKFFAGVRPDFGGKLKAATVRGISAVLDEWEARELTDLRHLAYILSTVRGECGDDMLPVREGFKKTDEAARAFVKRQKYKYAVVVKGQVFYGRGLAQLTWLANYQAMSKLVHFDLVAEPDLALEPPIAAMILFEGMIRGTFTGKKLSDYFNATKTDWINARRIINGTDKADKFAGYAKQFFADLTTASN